jgi:hypothetical protein
MPRGSRSPIDATKIELAKAPIPMAVSSTP